MTRIAFNAALLATALLAVSVRAQQTSPVRLGPEDGLLGVTVDGKHGFIDLTGRFVIPPTFDFAWQFSEGLASAWQNGRAGFIDRNGKFVISPRFEYAKVFHEGLAEVQLGGLWGFVSTDDRMAIQPQFEQTRWFSEGRAPVRVDGRWGYVDKAGDPSSRHNTDRRRSSRTGVRSYSWSKSGSPSIEMASPHREILTISSHKNVWASGDLLRPMARSRWTLDSTAFSRSRRGSPPCRLGSVGDLSIAAADL